ncbi:actinoporin-like protein isoform X2 [Conger conger]|nr:actinoporin-like protein isoform X2 [Conger conger]
MSESAEANMSSRRNITIEIKNLTKDFCLANPKVYLDSGVTFNPPQPTVRPLKTEVCSFSKTSGQAQGSVGVLTYDLMERTGSTKPETLCMMFSVPYDYNLYMNWFAVGIFGKGRNCDESLFKEMYYNDESGFVRAEANGSGINYIGTDLDVKATMSPMGRAIMKVEVWDKLFIPQAQKPKW